ncbi:hypothetical protein F5888DRAFT_126806 [Russula emetica]|nr:hypothetical protein F5888DRAFT_126806 [Russula emetica]
MPFFLDPHYPVSYGLRFKVHLYHSTYLASITMKQPLFKRRRVLSNPHTPLPSSDSLVTSLKPSRTSTCTSCHRVVCLKSNPAFLCARCSASTCVICLRTCMAVGDPVSSPRWTNSLNLGCDSTAIPLSQSNTNNSSPRRRRPRDEDSDDVLKSKDVNSERSGCGQMVCRMCCFEHPQSGNVACLDCSAKQLAPQTHESNASMQGARNSDHI